MEMLKRLRALKDPAVARVPVLILTARVIGVARTLGENDERDIGRCGALPPVRSKNHRPRRTSAVSDSTIASPSVPGGKIFATPRAVSRAA